MRPRSLALAAIVAVLTWPVAAQSLAGKWNATVDSPNGPFSFVFDLLVDAGGALTGTMQSEFFPPIPIKEATLKGNDVAFKITFEGLPDGSSLTVSYTGTVKGDELALVSKLEGAAPGGGPTEQAFTAHRSK